MQHQYYILPDGKRLHYTVWGNPDHQSVLCVHGLTRNARDFDVLAAHLADTFYVVCVDVIGRGESDWAESADQYTVINYAQQLLLFIGALGLKSPHWVGTSMGGLIAMTVQAIKPNTFQKLVLNDVGPVVEKIALQRIAKYIGMTPEFASRADALTYAKQVFVSFGAKTDHEWAGLTDHYYIDLPDGKVGIHYDPLIASATKAAVSSMNPEALIAGEVVLWKSIESLQQPCLVLRGETSDLLTQSTVDKMKALNPIVSAATIQGCGHAPHLLDAYQTKIIKDFLV